MSRTLGDQILSVLEMRDIKQYQAAKAIGISKQALNSYIKNHRFPDPEILGRIATYLDLDLNEIYKVSSKEPSKDFHVTQEEAKALKYFRKADSDMQKKILDIIKTLVDE